MICYYFCLNLLITMLEFRHPFGLLRERSNIRYLSVQITMMRNIIGVAFALECPQTNIVRNYLPWVSTPHCKKISLLDIKHAPLNLSEA